jgi:hypothetical protein
MDKELEFLEQENKRLLELLHKLEDEQKKLDEKYNDTFGIMSRYANRRNIYQEARDAGYIYTPYQPLYFSDGITISTE